MYIPFNNVKTAKSHPYSSLNFFSVEALRCNNVIDGANTFSQYHSFNLFSGKVLSYS